MIDAGKMTDLSKTNDFYSYNDGCSPFAVNRTMYMNKDYSREQGFADSGPVCLQINIKSSAILLQIFSKLIKCFHHVFLN